MPLLCKLASLVIMKILLGLFFFSLLLMTVTALECEFCTADAATCSGKRQVCPPGQDACINAVTKARAEGKMTKISTMKACSRMTYCGLFKLGFQGWNKKHGNFVINIQCSKALASSGSFLLTLLGLLLLNFLF